PACGSGSALHSRKKCSTLVSHRTVARRTARFPPRGGGPAMMHFRGAKGAARTSLQARDCFAPHSVLREFPGSAKGAARTAIRIRNCFAPHSVLREFLGIVALVFAGTALCVALAQADDRRVPVIVELFTSEGC